MTIPSQQKIRPVQSILILRSSAMGDIVMASPMIRAIKRAYPQVRLFWLVEPPFAALLRDNPAVDGLILFEKARWRTLLKGGKLLALFREILALRRALQAQAFDLVLDVQGLARSRFLAWLSGAAQRIGLASREPGNFLMTRIIERGGKRRMMSSEYCHILAELGIDTGDFQPELCIAPQDEQNALAKLQGVGVHSPYVVIAPFTTRPQKHWFDERWLELAAAVQEQLGLPVVMLGGPTDQDHAARIADASAGAIVNLAGQLSLMQSAAVIKHAAVLVGVDTGLTHMGTAFRRPTVALFGATRPYLETGSPCTRVLYHPLPCSPCRRSPTCSGEFTCMAAITGVEVMENLVNFIAQGNSVS